MAKYGEYPSITDPSGGEELLAKKDNKTVRITIDNIVKGVSNSSILTKAETDASITELEDTRLLKAGDTMSGTLDMGANKITTTYTPVNDADLTTKVYTDDTYIPLSGGTFTGTVTLAADPTNALEPSTKQYADAAAKGTYIGTLEDYTPLATNAFPTTYNSLAIQKGASFYITAAGTMASGAVTVQVGDVLIATVATPTDAAADWAVINTNVVAASTSTAGILPIATNAEVLAYSETAKAVTPASLGAALDAGATSNITIVSGASYTLKEEDKGIINLTHNSANRTITLPAISSLGDTAKTRYTIVNAAASTTYGTKIVASGGNKLGPLALSTLHLTYPMDYIEIYCDGTNWQFTNYRSTFSCGYDLSANQTITTATSTDIQWDQIKGSGKDPYTWMDLTTNYEFAPTATGIWAISCTVEFAADSTGQREVRLYRNGESNAIAAARMDAAASGTTMVTASTVGTFTAAAPLRVEVYQDSGGNLDIVNGNECYLQIRSISQL